jgi:hypothetical protein
MMTQDQLDQLLERTLAKGLEIGKQSVATSTDTVTQATEGPAAEATPVQVDDSGAIYGNLDKTKEFDLAKLIPGLKEFPKDKIVIVLQQYSTDKAGDVTETKKLRKAQFIDIADFIANTKKDPDTGDTLWDVMQIRYTVVNDPRK